MTSPSPAATEAAPTAVRSGGSGKGARIAGWVLSGLGAAFMAFSATGKFLQPPDMVPMIEKLGWKMPQMTAIGVLEVACVVLFLIPRTGVLGAVLLTGYLGGAAATHVRIEDSWVMPVALGVVFWVAVALREPRVWGLLPVVRRR